MNNAEYKTTNYDISIVIPAYNEERNIKLLSEKIAATLEPLNKSYEVIFIDDGSSDSTFKEMREAGRSNKAISPLRLRKNFGKSTALALGFSEARGNIIITMDADLQDEPAEIPRLIEKIDQGWDLVLGWRKVRKDSFEKRVSSKIFNFVVSKISGVRLHDFNCGFKAYKHSVAKTIKIHGEFHRFIPVIVSSQGFKVCEIVVTHNKRKFGKSKFGSGRYLTGLFDLVTTIFITQYLRRPLHFLGKVSLASFGGGAILLLYVIVMKFVFGQTGNRPSLIISVFLLGFGIQILLFGLLADILSYNSQKDTFKKEDFIKSGA